MQRILTKFANWKDDVTYKPYNMSNPGYLINTIQYMKNLSDGLRSLRTLAVTLVVLMMTATMARAVNRIVNVEVCEGGAGFIHLKGWAYSPDNPEEALELGIAIFTNEACTSPYGLAHSLMANIQRTDVAELQDIPGNHGFEVSYSATPGKYWLYFIGGGTEDGYIPLGDILTATVTAMPSQMGTVTITPETGVIMVDNGAILTGTGGLNTHIMIADGATVTLNGIDITNENWGGENPSNITCLGDATIILAKATTNYIRGGRYTDPCIQAGPKNSTLTIKGYGSLVLRSYGNGACIGGCLNSDCGNIVIEGGIMDLNTKYTKGDGTASGHAACIGSGRFAECGDITISGGNISAESTFGAAAIGGGREATCGNINITGGTVYAYANSPQGGASIGAGLDGTCGNISISGVTSVSALRRSDLCLYCIGPGNGNSTCGTLTLWGQTSDYIVGEPHWIGPNVFAPTDVPYTIRFNPNGGTGTMTDQGFYSNLPQALTDNGFSLPGKAFKCWSTEVDGSGYDYLDRQTVTNLGNVTLYAQWANTDYVVSYDPNGGTGSMEDQNFAWNSPQALYVNTFEFSGYDFIGWNTKPDGSGDSYNDKQSVSDLGNVILYAQWEDVLYRSHTYQDGDIISGTGGANTHITIADGATVTLSGATITGHTDQWWPGITCEGDATILLDEGTTNIVAGGSGWSGIYVPQNKTLTIQGSGTLIAYGSSVLGYDAAAIGGGGYYESSCGNIVITGGIITATGGNGAAGIGGGRVNKCGNISITGGTITANGGNYAPGIGSGMDLYCGNITITNGVTRVTATKGIRSIHSIGAGSESTCGTVTIGGLETGGIPQSPFIYNPLDTTPYTVTFDANNGTGTTSEQQISANTVKALNANTFTRERYEFMGWNTAADGSGTCFADGQTVFSLGDITLYAQWRKLQDTVTLTSETTKVTLYDGDILTGTGGNSTYVNILDGATVTLRNVNIISYSISIICLGNATIILEGTNIVVSKYDRDPGILIGSTGTTLTIRGDGLLEVAGGINAPGIGTNGFGSYGNIAIEGGTIIARGGERAAGIGCGYHSEFPPTCGTITIGSDIIRITATPGNKCNNAIGGACSGVIIAEGLKDVTEGNTRTITSGIPYIDYDGTKKKRAEYIELTNETDLSAFKTADPEERWFVVNDADVNLGPLEIYGTTHIIVSDNASVTFESSETNPIYHGGMLNIYGGPKGNGRLTATSTSTSTAISVRPIAGPNGIPGYLNIYGGQVTATSSGIGIQASSGLTLSWTCPTNSIKASSYGGYPIVATGKAFTTDGTDLYTGTLTPAVITALAGQTLRPVCVLNENDGATTLKSAPWAGVNDATVAFSRSFTQDVASTICLPYPMTDIEGGSVYEFVDVQKDNGVWVATMSDATPDGNKVTATVAGKPYLFMPSATGNVTFTGTVEVSENVTAGTSTSDTNDGTWTFQGTYSRLAYKADGTADLDGTVFGFASSTKEVDGNMVNAGQFVKAKDGAGVPAFRAYLTYQGSNDMFRAPARRVAESDADIPDRITVRLLGKDSTLTAVGTMDTANGNVKIEKWFDMQGRPVEGTPTQPGMFINNSGSKLMIK